MDRLNLIDTDKGNISYEVQCFPDGQRNIKVVGYHKSRNINMTFGVTVKKVMIVSRMNSFLDVELILCATASLRACGYEEVSLFVPYFLGARSDRAFEYGTNNYLKTVICPIINLQNYKRVIVLDPHSYCLEMGLDKMKAIMPNYHLTKAIEECSHGFYVVSPDAGAQQRVDKHCRALGLGNEVLVCSKKRVDGKIINTNVPVENIDGKDCVIIDDICSKGGTFIGIAKALKEKGANKIMLVVSHYEGTANEQDLINAGITKVFTTNSISDVASDFVFKIDISEI